MNSQYGSCKSCAVWQAHKGHEAMGKCRRHPLWHDTHEGHGCWDFIERPKRWTKVQWLLFGVGIGMWALWIAQRMIDLAG